MPLRLLFFFGSLRSTGPNRVRSLTIGFGKSLTIADDRATIFGGDPVALFPPQNHLREGVQIPGEAGWGLP